MFVYISSCVRTLHTRYTGAIVLIYWPGPEATPKRFLATPFDFKNQHFLTYCAHIPTASKQTGPSVLPRKIQTVLTKIFRGHIPSMHGIPCQFYKYTLQMRKCKRFEKRSKNVHCFKFNFFSYYTPFIRHKMKSYKDRSDFKSGNSRNSLELFCGA